MSYLLDTSTFVWFIYDERRLSDAAFSLLANSDELIYLSLVSIWELAIKANLGRGLELRQPFPEFIDYQLTTNRFKVLNIYISHLKRVSNLPLFHRDPFDRLLIAQSFVEDIPVITSDTAFDHYAIERIW